MDNFKKWIIGGLISLLLIQVGGGLLTAYLWEEKSMIFPVVVVIGVVIFTIGHVILGISNKTFEGENYKRIKNWAWVTGVCSLLCLVILLWFSVNPETNNILRSALFPTSVCILSEDDEVLTGTSNDNNLGTESTPIDSANEDEDNDTKWFFENCIPASWEIFNYEAFEDNGCWDFGAVNLKGIDNGFVIKPNSGIRSFYMYRPFDQISEISFIFEVKDLITLDEEKRTDFYFGFIPFDTNKYYTTDPVKKVHFNGDFIFISGQMKDSSYGFIRQRLNPLDDFNPIPADKEFIGDHLYQVMINISDDHWDVRIKDLTDNTAADFLSKDNYILGNYFVFGFRIRESGIMDIKVSNLHVE